MSNVEEVRRVVVPLLAPLGLELYDVERTGAILRITVDRAGGVDLDTIADVTRTISHALDDHDVIVGQYTLEVSSPGLERRLRTPAHFRSSIGETVRVKSGPDRDLPRRLTGELIAADDLSFVVRTEAAGAEAADEVEPTDLQIQYADVERARTVFEWEPASRANEPRHRSPSRGSSRSARSSPHATRSGHDMSHHEKNKRAAS